MVTKDEVVGFIREISDPEEAEELRILLINRVDYLESEADFQAEDAEIQPELFEIDDDFFEYEGE